MAGTIVADTLTHSTAGSIATNYVVEGSIKHWVNITSTGTAADSFNTSTITDDATGQFTVNISSAMGNASYVLSFCPGAAATASDSRGIFGTAIQSSSQYKLDIRNADGNETDHADNMTSAVGDLA